MEFKVLVTTSGTGSRLGELTKYTNKALVKVGKKPVISYIIENYPKNTEFVVTLGYFGDQVRDFLALAYPELRVTFVDVDTYQGEGSSLGYSMLQAKEHLQCPFIYQACDTIVTEPIDAPGRNWIAGFRGQGSSQYASFDSINGKLQKIYDKGMMDPDYIHIGLVGINDYENFWKFLEKAYSDDPKNSSLNDVDALRLLVSQGITFDVKGYKEWHDIGNVESLHNARKNIKDEFRILDKPEESIFIFNDFVIKFFSDKNIAIDRVKRAKNLEGIVPNILASTENFYKYEYSTGALYADVANSIDITSLVTWGEKNLWKETSEVSQEDFKKVCLDFYCTKTKKRVEQFFATRSIADTEHVINGQQVPTIQELLQQVDFDYLAIAEQTGFHGDFI
ncbi:MAG: NDP-sugar synthase, partial [Candidatus Andersenbacteria bacterium]